MTAYCDLTPDVRCKTYVDVPREAVEAFELRLEDRLRQRNLARLTPRIRSYTRRYWAHRVGKRIVVEGFFRCLDSELWEAGDACSGEADPEGERSMISADDAADCAISVQFFADKPRSLEAEAARHHFEAQSNVAE